MNKSPRERGRERGSDRRRRSHYSPRRGQRYNIRRTETLIIQRGYSNTDKQGLIDIATSSPIYVFQNYLPYIELEPMLDKVAMSRRSGATHAL